MNTEPCSSLESSGRFDLSMVVEGLLTMMITLVLGWSIAGLVIGVFQAKVVRLAWRRAATSAPSN